MYVMLTIEIGIRFYEVIIFLYFILIMILKDLNVIFIVRIPHSIPCASLLMKHFNFFRNEWKSLQLICA